MKWVDTRWGLTRSTVHGRDQKSDVTLAGTQDGKITALYCRNFGNMGAYPATNGPSPPVVLTSRSVTGAYAIPHPCCEVFTAFTNTVLVGPIRGSGRTEAMFFIERAVDSSPRNRHGPRRGPAHQLRQARSIPLRERTGLDLRFGQLQKAEPGVGDDRLRQSGGGKAEARRRGKRMGVGIGATSPWPGWGHRRGWARRA